jgi:hypothetical protein
MAREVHRTGLKNPDRRVRSQGARRGLDLMPDWIASVVSQRESRRVVAKAASFWEAQRSGTPTVRVESQQSRSTGLRRAQVRR